MCLYYAVKLTLSSEGCNTVCVCVRACVCVCVIICNATLPGALLSAKQATSWDTPLSTSDSDCTQRESDSDCTQRESDSDCTQRESDTDCTQRESDSDCTQRESNTDCTQRESDTDCTQRESLEGHVFAPVGIVMSLCNTNIVYLAVSYDSIIHVYYKLPQCVFLSRNSLLSDVTL